MIDNRFVNEFKPGQTDVAICGSMVHKPRLLEIIRQLEGAGLTVSTPEMSEAIVDWSSFTEEQIVERKGFFIRRHFANIAVARTVLVCNYEKNGIENYVGTNTLMEMTAGFVYEKPLYLLNPVPDQNGREEILAMQPTVLDGSVTSLVELLK